MSSYFVTIYYVRLDNRDFLLCRYPLLYDGTMMKTRWYDGEKRDGTMVRR